MVSYNAFGLSLFVANLSFSVSVRLCFVSVAFPGYRLFARVSNLVCTSAYTNAVAGPLKKDSAFILRDVKHFQGMLHFKKTPFIVDPFSEGFGV